ncbi:hypothetical protein QOZ80_3BG0289400 [Eleusine coracana subsp. coracana]|nr:hypothetical protein QOZ80_3BG0289400 [Eleusine coracana subsp. coracana]
MFPDGMTRREHGAVVRASATTKTSRGTRANEQPSAERDGRLPVVAVAVGGQRGTLYDSFELNAMVARLNRVLNGGEAMRRPRRAAASWLAAPKVLFRKIKGAFFGARRGGI